MDFTFNNKRTLLIISAILAVPLSFLFVSGDQITPRAHFSLFLASLAGALNSFTTIRVQKILRYVPLKSVLTVALCFQNFEILLKAYRNNEPITAATFFPLAVIAAYLFSSRLSSLILKSTNTKSKSPSSKTPTPKS